MTACFTHYPDPDRFASQIEAFERQERSRPSPKGAIVFTGASTIRHWHDRLAADFEPLTVLGRGFGGASLNDVFYFLDRLLGTLEPRALVLYAGGHDVRHGASPAQVLNLFQRLHSRLVSINNKIRIYAVSVKPVPARMQFWQACRELNDRMQAYSASQPNVHFLNVTPAVLGADNQPKMSFYGPDKIHLNRQGYLAWLRIIRPILLEHELPRL